jgi:hypothetical protein
MVATAVSETLGQPFIVENKPSARWTCRHRGSRSRRAGRLHPDDALSAYATAVAVNKVNFDPIGVITPIVKVSQASISSSCALRPGEELPGALRARKGDAGMLNVASAGVGRHRTWQRNVCNKDRVPG